MRVTDPTEFDLLKVGIEEAEKELEKDRRDLAARIARAMNGKAP